MDFPVVFFAVAYVVLWISAKWGLRYSRRIDDVREDYSIILTATLTLLGLIVGFTFSMAVGRYDQRKICEEEEANAIGTEYLRADLLHNSEDVRSLLRDYLDQRILFYRTRNERALQAIGGATAQLQTRLWAAVKDVASAQQTPVVALSLSGMNDVLNSQGYTQAAWLNRIPVAAWTLLVFIAICANVMVGLSVRNGRAMARLIAILPLIVSVSLLLIADIDSPRGGLIHVKPVNLMSVAASLRSPGRLSSGWSRPQAAHPRPAAQPGSSTAPR
jgi:hypothetical protein